MDKKLTDAEIVKNWREIRKSWDLPPLATLSMLSTYGVDNRHLLEVIIDNHRDELGAPRRCYTESDFHYEGARVYAQAGKGSRFGYGQADIEMYLDKYGDISPQVAKCEIDDECGDCYLCEHPLPQNAHPVYWRAGKDGSVSAIGQGLHQQCLQIMIAKEKGEGPTLEDDCESCGGPSTKDCPTHKYKNGASYHDQCADESGIPEDEMESCW